MTDIKGNIAKIRQEIPAHVRIVAVSKTMPASDILQAYETGHRIFGENRVQELLQKREKLPDDIEWHMIGHLQSNKVKLIVPYVALIESVDSHKLVSVINREAEKRSVTASILLQFHIAREETKSGFTLDEAEEMMRSKEFKDYRNIRICGVMGMATYTSDQEVVREEFRALVRSFNHLKNKYFAGNTSFQEISMGMSGDYMVAIEEGSTMIRVGSIIFGERD